MYVHDRLRDRYEVREEEVTVQYSDLQRLTTEFAEMLGGEVTDMTVDNSGTLRDFYESQGVEIDAMIQLVEATYAAIAQMSLLMMLDGLSPMEAAVASVKSAMSTMFSVGWEAHRQYGKESTDVG